VDFEEWIRAVVQIHTGDPNDEDIVQSFRDEPGFRDLFEKGLSPRAADDRVAAGMHAARWNDEIPKLTNPQWRLFRNRLRQEMNRAGLSQQGFADALREQSDDARGTSLRTLINYLNGDTQPSLRWARTAARILRVRPEWLLQGEEPRSDEVKPSSLRYSLGRKGDPRARLFQLLNAYHQIPWTARDAMLRFLWDYYEGASALPEKEPERVLRRFFEPLLTGAGRLSYAEAVAAAYSLASAAYLTTGLKGGQ
jgi:transcriptional regulator with XRE-family HTH domain